MKVGRWLSKLRHSAIDWISHRIFFSKAALFISGLVSSHGLVEYAVMGILIDYLAEYWKHSHLQGYAAVVNVQDAISATMAVVIAHISDAYVGRFKIVLFTNAAYLSAFVLLWLSTSSSLTPKNEVWILYPALFLAALGKAGREPSLKAFLADQLSERRLNLEIDEEQVEARRRVWWRVAWFLGAAMAVIFLANASWIMIFKISTMVMGISYFLFVSGTTFYYCEKPSESPLRYVFRVFKAALAKRHLGYPQTASQFFKNDSDQLQLLPHISLFRWLDKAAIVDTLLPEEQEKKGKLCTVAQVKEVKLVLNMVPLWITFLAYSLIVAAGTTFFYAQGSNMDNRVGDQFTVPLIYFYVIRCMLNFIIYILYVPLVPKKWTDTKKRKAAQVRIALGLICSILCCSTAAVVEAHRLSLVSHLDDPSETIPMSILWLAPQFCLLGLMEGFAESGLYEFFYEMVAKSMEKYGPSFNTCVVGIGGCLSIPMVFICDSWFGDTINNSRLDLYYTVLAIISFLNLCLYWCVSRKCIYKDDDQDTIVEDSFVRLLTKSFSTGTHSGHHSSSSEIMCSSSTTTGKVICKRANSYR